MLDSRLLHVKVITYKYEFRKEGFQEEAKVWNADPVLDMCVRVFVCVWVITLYVWVVARNKNENKCLFDKGQEKYCRYRMFSVFQSRSLNSSLSKDVTDIVREIVSDDYLAFFTTYPWQNCQFHLIIPGKPSYKTFYYFFF